MFITPELHGIAAESGNVLEEKGHHSSCAKEEVCRHTHLDLIQCVQVSRLTPTEDNFPQPIYQTLLITENVIQSYS